MSVLAVKEQVERPGAWFIHHRTDALQRDGENDNQDGSVIERGLP